MCTAHEAQNGKVVWSVTVTYTPKSNVQCNKSLVTAQYTLFNTLIMIQ